MGRYIRAGRVDNIADGNGFGMHQPGAGEYLFDAPFVPAHHILLEPRTQLAAHALMAVIGPPLVDHIVGIDDPFGHRCAGCGKSPGGQVFGDVLA